MNKNELINQGLECFKSILEDYKTALNFNDDDINNKLKDYKTTLFSKLGVFNNKVITNDSNMLRCYIKETNLLKNRIYVVVEFSLFIALTEFSFTYHLRQKR